MLRDISENKSYSHICIVGDFNYKAIDWSTWNTLKSETSEEERFLDQLKNAFFFQHVNEPTRRRGSDKPSLLDLILTNEAMSISDLTYEAPLGKSDHCTLLFNFHCYAEERQPSESLNYIKEITNL